MVWFLLAGLVFGILVGYRLASQKAKPKFLLHFEYWVYLPGDKMPPQDEVMTQLVRPEVGPPSIGPKEALLFSDVRLHIALVLRSKNAYLFRPDLFAPYVDATPEQLEQLEAAKSFAKVRFVSEEPVPDRRFLKFLPQAARTIAELGDGVLIYDTIGERLFTPEDLRTGDPGPNVRWVAAAEGGHVETLGLKKLGISEIKTAPIAADERWIVTELVDQVARQAWNKGELPAIAVAEAFEDRFNLQMELQRDGTSMARIHRIQEI